MASCASQILLSISLTQIVLLIATVSASQPFLGHPRPAYRFQTNWHTQQFGQDSMQQDIWNDAFLDKLAQSILKNSNDQSDQTDEMNHVQEVSSSRLFPVSSRGNLLFRDRTATSELTTTTTSSLSDSSHQDIPMGHPNPFYLPPSNPISSSFVPRTPLAVPVPSSTNKFLPKDDPDLPNSSSNSRSSTPTTIATSYNDVSPQQLAQQCMSFLSDPAHAETSVFKEKYNLHCETISPGVSHAFGLGQYTFKRSFLCRRPTLSSRSRPLIVPYQFIPDTLTQLQLLSKQYQEKQQQQGHAPLGLKYWASRLKKTTHTQPHPHHSITRKQVIEEWIIHASIPNELSIGVVVTIHHLFLNSKRISRPDMDPLD